MLFLYFVFQKTVLSGLRAIGRVAWAVLLAPVEVGLAATLIGEGAAHWRQPDGSVVCVKNGALVTVPHDEVSSLKVLLRLRGASAGVQL